MVQKELEKPEEKKSTLPLISLDTAILHSAILALGNAKVNAHSPPDATLSLRMADFALKIGRRYQDLVPVGSEPLYSRFQKHLLERINV